MAKFKVLNCPQEKTVRQIRKVRTPDGNVVHQITQRTVQAGEEEWYPSAYGHVGIKPGDVIELQGRFADKARANPDFEEVTESAAKAAPEESAEDTEAPKRRRRKRAASADS